MPLYDEFYIYCWIFIQWAFVNGTISFSEKQTFYLSTTKFDSPFSESFTIRNTKPDFSSNHIILFQKRNQTVLIILTIICFICACIIFAKIVVWFHDGRRRGPGNAPNTVQIIPEHGFVYENIENFGSPALEIQ